MGVAFTAAVVGILLSLISLFARKEGARFKSTTNVYKMQKTLIYTCLCVATSMIALAGFLWVQAIYYGGRHGGDAAVPATIGAFAALCALIWSLYEVRLEAASIRFGLAARRSLAYSEVKEIRDIRNQGSPRAVLIGGRGERYGLWSNLLGYGDLIDKLKEHCPSALYNRVGP